MEEKRTIEIDGELIFIDEIENMEELKSVFLRKMEIDQQRINKIEATSTEQADKIFRLEESLIDYETHSTENKFIQLSNQFNPLLRTINSKSTSAAITVLLFMAQHCDKMNKLYVKQEDIAEALELTTRTVRTAISVLKDHKIINIKNDKQDKRQKYYVLNSRVIWKSSIPEKAKSEFSENPEYKELKESKVITKKTIKTGIKNRRTKQ